MLLTSMCHTMPFLCLFRGLAWLHLTSPQHIHHCDEAYSLSIRVQTMLNHIQFVKLPRLRKWLMSAEFSNLWPINESKFEGT